MNLMRTICQYDYPATETAEKKPANASGCVLANLQMQIETITQKTYLETVFYEKLMRARVIREDCYINSYDDALRIIALEQDTISTPVELQRRMQSIARYRWQFFKKVSPPVDEQCGVFALPVPMIGYMAKRQHAVLITNIAVGGGIVDLHVIDPKFRGEKARYNMKPDEFKRFGAFVG